MSNAKSDKSAAVVQQIHNVGQRMERLTISVYQALNAQTDVRNADDDESSVENIPNL